MLHSALLSRHPLPLERLLPQEGDALLGLLRFLLDRSPVGIPDGKVDCGVGVGS